MAAGGGLSDTDPVFKSDFASLVHSSYREELDEDEEEQSEVLYQNMDEVRQEIHLSSISMVETVVAVNHQQQSREGEELAQKYNFLEALFR